MLKTRVIPTLLYKSVGLVKGKQFDSWRRVDTVLPAIKVYNMREVDELILLDIEATELGRDPDYEEIKGVSRECFVPLCVGGGIHNIEQVKQLLRVGADKVAINTAAYENIDLIKEVSQVFGSQCVVSSIDCKKEGEEYICFSHSGKINTNKRVQDWAKEVEKAGAGEILVTSISRDGEMKGYDLDLIKTVSESVAIPVIASGGAGTYEDMYQAIQYGNATAVAAASMYHFTEATPKEAKKYLKEKGVAVRL